MQQYSQKKIRGIKVTWMNNNNKITILKPKRHNKAGIIFLQIILTVYTLFKYWISIYCKTQTERGLQQKKLKNMFKLGSRSLYTYPQRKHGSNNRF